MGVSVLPRAGREGGRTPSMIAYGIRASNGTPMSAEACHSSSTTTRDEVSVYIDSKYVLSHMELDDGRPLRCSICGVASRWYGEVARRMSSQQDLRLARDLILQQGGQRSDCLPSTIISGAFQSSIHASQRVFGHTESRICPRVRADAKDLRDLCD